MAAAPLPIATEVLDVPTALAWAHPVVQRWFVGKFGTPTEPQIEGWPAILRGEPTLISAPTGSGKTLTAFLVAINRLVTEAMNGTLSPYTQIVYVSPLKALSNDVQKNLEEPLREILQLAMEAGFMCPGIRTGVRTGDTLPKERVAMLKHPPHILVTTPESLYLLLTSAKARENLRCVHTVIVDEIHAMADDKRGAHLALTLERLDALVTGENHLTPGAMLMGMSKAPQRIGLSATQNPIELVADFLTGIAPGRKRATIIQVGQRRVLDLAIEIPATELGSVRDSKMWIEIVDRMAELAREHRSTLVFVNTRSMVERLCCALGERLGEENVAAHHGSLSRALRLDAEQRLKAGEIQCLVATASLELGIDIGAVDLVIQLNSTRAVAVAMQRVGRAGHWRGAIPKGRFFASTRDDLLEQAALVRAMRSGSLDKLEIPPQPRDVLMQQMVAMCGAEPWEEDTLFALVTRAYPYRDLSRTEFDEIVTLLHTGIENSRGRYGAYLLRDGVAGVLHPRRGARMTAIGNGGAIPDTAMFSVVLMPEGHTIATLGEHFAVDSGPGDVIQLGNSSWRILTVEKEGRVLVEDAHGAPPSVPFWDGEAPQRTDVLSDFVGDLRKAISDRTQGVHHERVIPEDPVVADAVAWLMEECAVCESAAMQLVQYIVSGRAVLGCVPTKTTIVAERFFDEGGGMQLILHAPFGGRINKAWGLALRKRFCRGFNYELQAAATDNGINICLAEQHSFPLADVFHFLTEHTAKELLEQASLASPIFKTRWRWAANRSLQLLRFSKGKKVPPQIQRTRGEDLLASVFPQAAACFETIVGDIQIPDHPLVREVMQDVLQEAMDLEGLQQLLRDMHEGRIECIAVDTPVPSLFSHELLNANQNAFLDEADLGERRARAVSLRGTIPDSVLGEAGRLDPAAIRQTRCEIWPDLRDEHELHDLLFSTIALPVALFREQPSELAACSDEEVQVHRAQASRHWPLFFERLQARGRAQILRFGEADCWVATERLEHAQALQAITTNAVVPSEAKQTQESQENATTEPTTTEEALRLLTQGILQILGPTTARSIAALLALQPRALVQQLVAMEMQGLALRGIFEAPAAAEDDKDVEWCERRILQRIHRLTLGALRKQIEAVTPAVFMRWLVRWQHLAPQTQLAGEEGVLEALLQLEGFEAPAVEWERNLLPQRVKDYDGKWLDQLCLSGAVGWGRISPHPAWAAGDGAAPRRVIPTNMAPITFFLRESADWLPAALAAKCIEEDKLQQALSPEALCIRNTLRERGACFASDLQRMCVLSKQQTQTALWELATAGIASADGFDQLRIMMDPKRKPLAAEPVVNGARRGTRSTAGRWSLFTEEEHRELSAPERAREQETSLAAAARMLLARYGVVFRDLLQREANVPKWRDLVRMLRRLEARGEIRGGRFVQGFNGEQFALPEAVESMRATRDLKHDDVVTLAASDPINLIGVVVPGERTNAVAGKKVHLRGGVPCDAAGEPLDAIATPQGIRRNTAPRTEKPMIVLEAPQGGLFA
ncbi:Lhr-like helicase [Terriglobus roseus DSM 18391]|uniref:Lhr-like helicase n=1 Tax=Terriglobus roseus (strain DSM 18391 / NRRL B-41598 / KBS 63) TaxID=926566 RepID=I3ZBV0_TERRK|nr:DEAD/DEAH box helicase [Terriglobus roseus]AFL86718.1 Lhr-like helicase [Terriglobus roseus DSM 18391]